MSKKSQVKSHYRKGKLVKSHNRKQKLNIKNVLNTGLALGSLALIPYAGYKIIKNPSKLRTINKDFKKVDSVVRQPKNMSENTPDMKVEIPKEVKESLSNLTSNIKRIHNLKYRGNLKVKGLKGKQENTKRIKKRLNRINYEIGLDPDGYGEMFRKKPLNQYDRKTRRSMAQQIKKSANSARLRANADLDSILDKDTGYNSYLNLITFNKPKQEKNVKVKSFTREGRLVRGFNRKQKVNQKEKENKKVLNNYKYSLLGIPIGLGIAAYKINKNKNEFKNINMPDVEQRYKEANNNRRKELEKNHKNLVEKEKQKYEQKIKNLTSSENSELLNKTKIHNLEKLSLKDLKLAYRKNNLTNENKKEILNRIKEINRREIASRQLNLELKLLAKLKQKDPMGYELGESNTIYGKILGLSKNKKMTKAERKAKGKIIKILSRFNFNNIINFNKPKQEKNVKVKSFTRKGKLVRGFNRKQKVNQKELRNKIITGLGGAAVGAGLLGAGVLIGRGKKPQIIQQNINTDDIINNIKNEINKQRDEINNIVEEKLKGIQTNTISNIDENKIISAVNNAVNKQKKEIENIIESKLSNITRGSSNVVGMLNNKSNINLQDLPIRKVSLPQKIDNLSEASITKLTEKAKNLSDSDLENEINKLSTGMVKYQESLLDINKLNEFNQYLKSLSPEELNKTIGKYMESVNKSDPLAVKNATNEATEKIQSYKNYIYKQILNDLAPHFKLDITSTRDIERMVENNLRFRGDVDYEKKLKKLVNRRKNQLDIYQKEYLSRKKDITPSYESKKSTDEDELERLRKLINQGDDDQYGFMRNNKLVKFKRPKGAKDKKKRKRNFITPLKGIGGLGLGAITIGKLKDLDRDGIKIRNERYKHHSSVKPRTPGEKLASQFEEELAKRNYRFAKVEKIPEKRFKPFGGKFYKGIRNLTRNNHPIIPTLALLSGSSIVGGAMLTGAEKIINNIKLKTKNGKKISS